MVVLLLVLLFKLQLLLLLCLTASPPPGLLRPSCGLLRRFCSRKEEPGRFATDSIAEKSGTGAFAATGGFREAEDVTSAADFAFFASGVVTSEAMRTGYDKAGRAGEL